MREGEPLARLPRPRPASSPAPPEPASVPRVAARPAPPPEPDPAGADAAPPRIAARRATGPADGPGPTPERTPQPEPAPESSWPPARPLPTARLPRLPRVPRAPLDTPAAAITSPADAPAGPAAVGADTPRTGAAAAGRERRRPTARVADPTPGSTRRQRRAEQRRRRQEQQGYQLRRSLRLTLMSVLLPGLGLLGTARRRLGLVMATLSALVLLALGVTALSGGVLTGVSQLLTSKGLLLMLLGSVALGIAWVLGVMLTARETARASWAPGVRATQRAAACVMTLVVALPAAAATQYVAVTQGALGAMTLDRYTGRGGPARAPGSGADAWDGIPRVNLLLIGSDAGPDRVGVRTDSVMLASIDTVQGDTTLVSIPRNLRGVPFPQSNPLHALYPDGFSCPDCLMDAVWQEAEVNQRTRFPADETHPGLDTTREVVEEITGQSVDYTVVIDLSGFEQLVDAMGGVEIDVPRRLPIGGRIVNGRIQPGSITGWIEPGRRRLDGYHALWYSRSRVDTSDYDRMRRQRCMVNALVGQANPFSLLQRFPQIMRVVERNILMDVPQDHLPALAQLVRTMQGGNMRSVNLAPPVIDTSRPDYRQIRQLVAAGIATPHDDSAAAPSSPVPATSSSTSAPSDASGTPTAPGSPSSDAITDTRGTC